MAAADLDRPAVDSTQGIAAELHLPDDQGRRLSEWILAGEDWLIRRIIAYAKSRDYTRYTSTLEEAWRLSIQGLSRALADALDAPRQITGFTPDERFDNDPLSAFAVVEAERHRLRGTDLRMFLGLFKYYRQTYLDWLCEAELPPAEERAAAAFVVRLFDRWEIAFCGTWAQLGGGDQLAELQRTARAITNEKNRFLTVTESLGSPVILLDEGGRITYANRAAAPLVGLATRPGTFYYGSGADETPVPDWLRGLVKAAGCREWSTEQVLEPDGVERVYDVRLRPMLDVSEKFQGMVVILHDISDLRRAERAIAERARHHEQLAMTDPLTGLLNRRGLLTLADKHLALALRNDQPLSVLFLDVDDLKGINDRFGHSIGDRALVAVASALERSFRAADTIARVGGDEYVVVLVERDDDATSAILDRVAENLTAALAAAGLEIEVEFSTGWASLDPGRHRSFERLLADADAAMYSTKRSRRDHPES